MYAILLIISLVCALNGSCSGIYPPVTKSAAMSRVMPPMEMPFFITCRSPEGAKTKPFRPKIDDLHSDSLPLCLWLIVLCDSIAISILEWPFAAALISRSFVFDGAILPVSIAIHGSTLLRYLCST